MDLIAWLGRFKTVRAWAILIAIVNLVGIVYGFFYYVPQFKATPWWLWPFVPDSPLAVLWAELALFAYFMKRKPGALDALAFVGNVQVGLWTTYVFIAYPSFHALDWLTGGPVTLNAVLFWGHLGMAALAFIFVQGLRERWAIDRRAVLLALAIALSYYVVNDALDYFGPTHRLLPGQSGPAHECTDFGIRPWTVPCREPHEMWLAAVTFGLTLASVAVLAVLTRKR